MTADATRIPVVGASPYDVVVGEGVVVEHLPPLLAGATRCAVVVGARLGHLADTVVHAATGAGVTAGVVEIPDGEAAKTPATVERLWEAFAGQRITRSDVVVAVGGGATTDVAGFAAATWLRGVRWIPVPTTLLGMVDAAVGGKTGVNTAAGKNLAGAFHPPAGVLADLSTLRALPAPEWVNGMAEVVKAGMIADPVILELCERDPAAAATPTSAPVRPLVERAIAVKADVVGRDLRESGLREILNYGHTLGHAIELVDDYRRPHGHAVAIGMTFAAALSVASGRLDSSVAERQRRLLDALGLPTRYDGAGSWPALREAMTRDKKARGAVLRFIVLDGLGRPAILTDPAPDLLETAWRAVSRAAVASGSQP